jgi:stage II sporulation protein D
MAVVLTALWAGAAVRCALALNRPTVVRVAVLKEADGFSLTVRGSYRVVDPATDEELKRGRRLRRSDVKASPGGIFIGDQLFNVPRLRLIVQKDVGVEKGRKKYRYRGQLDIIREKDKFLVVNIVDLEEYVRGVLYHEVPHDWPLNAIMAQAVATRTYAFYQVGQKKKQAYDVTSDIYSQVYGGRSAERHRTNVAAGRTRGEILTYNGKVLPAYFHSNCGGHTEDASELWKHDLPPLKGVICRFCESAPNYRWKKNFRSQDVQGTLNDHGFSVGMIQDARVLNRTDSGRGG